MNYRLIIQPRAQKQYRKIPKQYKKKIARALDYIAADPFSGKKLRGEHRGQYTMRVWPYRIIYTIEKKKVPFMCWLLVIGKEYIDKYRLN